MTNKDTAVEIYAKHIALASVDGRGFRKTVMDEIMSTCGCSLAAAATFYNNAKKANPVEGLGRPAVSKGVKKPSQKNKDKTDVPDDECFTVLELRSNDGVNFQVGRCQSFIMQGDASEKFDEKIEAWPAASWALIQGLGPNSGESYRLDSGEKEIKRYPFELVEA